jgi:hypothetical protein
MSEAEGIQTFFQGLAQHLINTVNAPYRVAFEVGDSVYYRGSKVADHGYWQVVAVDEATRRVTIGKRWTPRRLVVNATSLDRIGSGLVEPLPTSAND